MPPRLYLIDGHALAYRTFFALSNTGERMQTRAGEPTAAIYGFASTIMRLLEQERPDYLAVAFDVGKTFRNDLFPAYKATRAKMPDDLRAQIEHIRAMVDAFGIPRLEKENAEADDVLGTIAHQAAEKGLGVKIITGDRDLLQLVDERIVVNLAGSKLSEVKDYSAAEVVAHLGVPPKQVVDYKALVGDTSDNIPGVAGVGEKTAIGLLAQYPTLDDIYAHLEDIPQRVRTKLESGRDSAYLSRDLATIRTDIAVVLDLEKADTTKINYAAAAEVFRRFEFRSLQTRLEKLAGGTITRPPSIPAGRQQLSLFGEEFSTVGTPPQYELTTVVIDTTAALEDLCRKLETAALIAFDTETTSTDPMRAALVGISLAIEEGTGYYIPVGHSQMARQLDLQTVIDALKPALCNPKIPKAGHNIKYDVLVLERHGLPVEPQSFDTMIAEWVVNTGSHNLGLKDMAADYLQVQMTHIEELIGKGKNQLSMAQVSVEAAAPYAAADAEVTLRLVPVLRKRLEESGSTRLFEDMEMPLIPVIEEMERNGVALDVTVLQKMSGELSQRMVEIEQAIHRMVGYSFNINSTQQLSKALFETLHLEPPDRKKKTAAGAYSTSADVLDEIRKQHPVVEQILEYRELSKLKSTYVDSLPLQINPQTGRVHTSYNQVGAVTGRLASSDPNLQNIPTRTDLGRKVRNAFTTRPGWVLLSVDYSQIELRIVAHMSGDEDMLSAFRAGQDIHATTAAAIYNLPLDQVTKEMRRHAKAINFGLIYGMSAFGLFRTTDLTLGEAEDFVRAYFTHFADVKRYLDSLRQLAARQGYVETLLGRKRYFPNLQQPVNQQVRAREEREAINAPVQGTAADILKIAMIQLLPSLRQSGLQARLLLQVHDELVLECPQTELLETARLVQNIMENAYPLSIPLLTEARSGENWGNLTPIIHS